MVRELMVLILLASQVLGCSPAGSLCGATSSNGLLGDLLRSLKVVPVGGTPDLPLRAKSGEPIHLQLMRSDGGDPSNLQLAGGSQVTISTRWYVTEIDSRGGRSTRRENETFVTQSGLTNTTQLQLALLGPVVKKKAVPSTSEGNFRIVAAVTLEADVATAATLATSPTPTLPLLPGAVSPPPANLSASEHLKACAELSQEVKVGALEVPTILALFRHADYAARNPGAARCSDNESGAVLLVFPSEYAPTLQELTTETVNLGATRDDLRTSVDRLALLSGATPDVGIPDVGRYVAAITHLRQSLSAHMALEDRAVQSTTDASLSNLSEIVFIDSLVCSDIDAEDQFSSFILIGVPGTEATMFVRRAFQGPPDPYLKATTDQSLSVVVRSLHYTNRPSSIPEGRLTTNMPESVTIDTLLGTITQHPDWGDTISSVVLN